MSLSRSNFLEELKIQASLLLKALQSKEVSRAKEAAERFKKSPEFSHLSLSQIIKGNEKIQRKHALDVVAMENGYSSWRNLQDSIEKSNASHIPRVQLTGKPNAENLYRNTGRLHLWFSNYIEAKNALAQEGGYLLVHKNQYFICGPDYIRDLGLDPDDNDWNLIGRDWAEPKDTSALVRLKSKLKSARKQK